MDVVMPILHGVSRAYPLTKPNRAGNCGYVSMSCVCESHRLETHGFLFRQVP